jgi:hypothetical protein
MDISGRVVCEPIMEGSASMKQSSVSGKHCNLRWPIRDRAGHSHFDEEPVILREIDNLERRMYLVRFNDGSETFVFTGELEVAA